MGGWFNLRQWLLNYHIFACHNSNVVTWSLRWSGGICGGHDQLVILLLVLLIYLSWIWMKSTSFTMRVSSRLLGAKINPDMKKNRWLNVCNVRLLGWEWIGCEWSSDISGKGCFGAPRLSTWWLYTDFYKDLVQFQTKKHKWMMVLVQRWREWYPLVLEKWGWLILLLFFLFYYLYI